MSIAGAFDMPPALSSGRQHNTDFLAIEISRTIDLNFAMMTLNFVIVRNASVCPRSPLSQKRMPGRLQLLLLGMPLELSEQRDSSCSA